VPYFHNVFTLPHELNNLILKRESNQRAILKLLFDATAQTLLEFGRCELRGQVGFTLLDQQLQLTDELNSAIYQRQLIRKLFKKPWVVYSKAPFAGPAKLIDYLSRYTHRVAVTNSRIKSCIDGKVTFSYRDRRDGDRRKRLTLPASQFIGRFLMHVLPDRFMRIRHYGFLANRFKKQRLATIRVRIGAEPPTPQVSFPSIDKWLQTLGIDRQRCPCCGDRLQQVELACPLDRRQRPALHANVSTRGPPT
jgi:hypothetical protein